MAPHTTIHRTVTADDTAHAVGSGTLPVLGTPRLLAWCEAASCAALEPTLTVGETSVGTRVELEHRAASPIGQQVEVTASQVYADGRLRRFTVAARHTGDGRVVATGEVTRVIVDAEGFLARVDPEGSLARVDRVSSSEVWDEETARRYDTDDAEMFAPQVLGPAVDRLADLAGEGRALELAIGTGRVGVALAARGVKVVGIELSEPMAARLRAKIDEERLPVVIGDMAKATAPGQFTLVYLVYHTITNLLTQEEQVACFRNAARHLVPGGRFVVECLVPPLRRLPPGQLACPFEVSEQHLGFDTFDLVSQRLVSHHFWPEGDGFLRVASQHRYAWPAEMDLMARLAGLTLEARYADWNGSPFTDDSTSHVSVWRLA